MQFLKSNAKLLAVAVVCLSAGMVSPAVASSVVAYANNADKVDGKHAVSAGAKIASRKGKLVATDGTTGRLPNNIIATAPDAAKLGGVAASSYLKNVQYVVGTGTTIAADGGYGTASVTCPAGKRIISGGFTQSDGVPSIDIFRSYVSLDGTTYTADGKNVSGMTNRAFHVWGFCAG